MALELLIAGNPRLAYLERESLRINQDAATYVSTCHLVLIDPNNVITAAIKDTVVVRDVALGAVYFDGAVANVDYSPIGGGASPRRRVKLQCQDNNILVEEAIIPVLRSFAGVPDNDIIAQLFAWYCPAITTLPANVHVVDGNVTIDFLHMTLREAMRLLCNKTGGFWFVRASDLYYGVEADFGVVPWDLSDTPDNVTSFSYLRDTARKFHGSNMVNDITVVGVLDAAAGINQVDGASIAIYGTHAAITTDNRISTAVGAGKRCQAILNKWSMPRESYTVKTFPGTRTPAIAGQRIRYINSVYGINAIYTIRRLNISFPSDTALYTMTLGDDLDLGILGQRIFLDKIAEALEPIAPMDLPLSSQGWTHDIVFTAANFNTVTWAGGDGITTADGTYFAINAGTTPAMGAATVYYIYLDIAVALNALQWNVAAANAVGPTRLLVAVAYPNADATKDAIFQVFGGEGQEVFITADNIAANTITANEIFANSITAGCMAVGSIAAVAIQANAITTIKIQAGAVTADKLQIGSMFFNDADGLLLLGPHCEINTTEWISLRRQTATISGAFHQEAGRWIDTRGLVIEIATTNIVENPSFEGVWNAWWAFHNQAGSGQNTTWHRYGDACLKMVSSVATDPYLWKASAVVNPVQDDTYSLSTWVKGEGATIGKTAKVMIREAGGLAGNGDSYSDALTLTSQWQRVSVSRKIVEPDRTALHIMVRLYCANTEYAYFDGIQLEKTVAPTSYCDGSLGAGYAWTGAVHASTSTRIKTGVVLDDLIDLISGVDTLSFRIVAQARYAYDAVWASGASNRLFEAAGAANNNILLLYDDATNNFRALINGAFRIDVAGSFAAGDWLDLVLTIDFSSNEYILYVNGIEEGTDTTALAAPTLTIWSLGAKASNEFYQSGMTFSEFAVFDKVLTATDVAQMYNLQRPLVDAGAINSPGIYIYDGRFRIASSTTGNRIEITPEEIAGYNSAGVKQFYLRSSDGVAMCGGGDVVLGADGISIELGAAATNRLRFLDSGVERGYVWGLPSGADTLLTINAGPPALAADLAELRLVAQPQAGNITTLYLVSRTPTGGIPGQIETTIDGVPAFYIKGTHVQVENDLRVGLGLVIGSTAVNPNADQLHFGHATYRLRRNGTHIEWYDGGAWVQLD